jgi:hypothetical protein
MSGRGVAHYELPPPARLAHDLLWARAAVTGRRPRLDDLEEADRLAALLIARWEPLRQRHRLRWPLRPTALRTL